jgi:hypothetical protein
MILPSIIDIPMLNAQPASSIYSNEQVEQTEIYKKGNEYQRDLMLFFDMLLTVHPAFAPGAEPPFDIEKACREGYAWAAKCESKEDLGMWLQSRISVLNDGHTLIARDYNNSLIYPFMFFEIDDKFYLQTVTRKYESFLGKQIVKINGTSTIEVIESFRDALSCENATDFMKQIRNVISFSILWEQNPYRKTDGTVVLTFADGGEIIIEPVTANNRDLVTLQPPTTPLYSIRQNTRAPFSYQIIENESICYLQFSSCQDQSTVRMSLLNNSQGLSGEQIEQQLARIPRFDAFVAKMFAEISSKNIATLVVDVRNNGGGNSALCEVLLSWLKPFDDMHTGSSQIRFSSFWEQCYPDLSERYKKAFAGKGAMYHPGGSL